MDNDSKTPDIKVTDRRHFDLTGEKRPTSEISPDPEPARAEKAESPPKPSGSAPKEPSAAAPGLTSAAPSASPETRSSGLTDSGPSGDMSEIATSLSSSFSLLVARLAQETEIYLGLVPYPGKETSEPDFEAARAMIDLLSMLQEKTRGNLEPEEARLLENLLYTYRLEFVRQRPDGGAR